MEQEQTPSNSTDQEGGENLATAEESSYTITLHNSTKDMSHEQMRAFLEARRKEKADLLKYLLTSRTDSSPVVVIAKAQLRTVNRALG